VRCRLTLAHEVGTGIRTGSDQGTSGKAGMA
jgi:hypothetical protein